MERVAAQKQKGQARDLASVAPRMSPFFELIQVAVGRRETLTDIPSEEEWAAVFEQARQQTLVGVLYEAVERLPKTQRPPRAVLLQWYMLVQQIKQANERLNGGAAALTHFFAAHGLRSVVLKGQGVALLYPHPELRMPGDIDLWVEGGRRKILEIIKNDSPANSLTYHHIDYEGLKGIKTEVHFTPMWMYCYWLNKKLQKYFSDESPRQFANRAELPSGELIGVPTMDFNCVFQLVHIFRHFLFEGIGLRQLMDYYFVLKQGLADNERAQVVSTLRGLGLYRFAGAVMYVQEKIFWLDKKFLLVEPRERDGEFLLEEVMLAGNFGFYDMRFAHKDRAYLHRTLRLSRFLKSYPMEVLGAVPFKLWHLFYRKWASIYYFKS